MHYLHGRTSAVSSMGAVADSVHVSVMLMLVHVVTQPASATELIRELHS
jgi:hypothetical protein